MYEHLKLHIFVQSIVTMLPTMTSNEENTTAVTVEETSI